jgi:hypothetical protein
MPRPQGRMGCGSSRRRRGPGSPPEPTYAAWPTRFGTSSLIEGRASSLRDPTCRCDCIRDNWSNHVRMVPTLTGLPRGDRFERAHCALRAHAASGVLLRGSGETGPAAHTGLGSAARAGGGPE